MGNGTNKPYNAIGSDTQFQNKTASFVFKKLKSYKDYIEWSSIKQKNVIGSGQSGTVYKGIYKNQDYALKIMKNGFKKDSVLQNTDDLQPAFIEYNNHKYAESKNASGVGKVRGFSCFEEHGLISVVLIFELYGSDLKQLIIEKKNININFRLSETQINSIFQQLLTILKNLSQQKIIHRDIKLANILMKNLINYDEITQNTSIPVVVSDLSEACFSKRDSTVNCEETLKITGTKTNLPPEFSWYYVNQEKTKCNGEKLDVFATAITILQLINFDAVVDRNGREEVELLKKSIEDQIFQYGLGPLQSYFSEVSNKAKNYYEKAPTISKILDLLENMLQFHPQNRYSFSEASEFYTKNIEPLLQNNGVQAQIDQQLIRNNEEEFDMESFINPNYHCEKQNHERALELYEMAKTESNQNSAIKYLNEAENLYPQFYKIYELLGDIQKSNILWQKKSVTNYEKALKLNPLDQNLILKKANQHEELNQFEEAIQEYTKIIEYWPMSYNTIIRRHYVYLKCQRFDEALQDINLAIRQNPGKSDLYYNRANIKLKNLINLQEEAIQDYTKAIELKQDWVFYLNRSIVYGKMQKYDEAIMDLKNVIELKNNNNDYDLFLQIAEYYYLKQDLQTAISYCNQAYIINKTNDEILLMRGQYLQKDGQIQNAYQDFSQIINQNENLEINMRGNDNSKHLQARYRRGIINLNDLQQYQEAKDDLTNCIVAKYNESQCYSMRGQANKYLQNYEAALEDLNEAISLDPTNQVALNNRAALQNNHLQIYEGAMQDIIERNRNNSSSQQNSLDLSRVEQNLQNAIIQSARPNAN